MPKLLRRRRQDRGSNWTDAHRCSTCRARRASKWESDVETGRVDTASSLSESFNKFLHCPVKRLRMRNANDRFGGPWSKRYCIPTATDVILGRAADRSKSRSSTSEILQTSEKVGSLIPRSRSEIVACLHLLPRLSPSGSL